VTVIMLAVQVALLALASVVAAVFWLSLMEWHADRGIACTCRKNGWDPACPRHGR